MTGQRVAHYFVHEQLGAGGMGVVYRATDTRLGRDVALKFLPSSQADDEVSLARFGREARVAAALNHPNICTIHDVGEHQGQRFIAMELLEGRSLKQVIAGGPIRSGLVMEWGAAITSALDAAHQKGIVHGRALPP